MTDSCKLVTETRNLQLHDPRYSWYGCDQIVIRTHGRGRMEVLNFIAGNWMVILGLAGAHL